MAQFICALLDSASQISSLHFTKYKYIVFLHRDKCEKQEWIAREKYSLSINQEAQSIPVF